MTPSKTILVVGKTGTGKSTICNIIVDKDIFPEGEYGVSMTKESKSETIHHNGVNYIIKDTCGLGDTSLTEREVLDRMASTFSSSTLSSIHQIIYVFNGKFSQQEIFTYKLLKTIFGQDVAHITTIVRTRFPKYKEPSQCEADKNAMMNESSDIREILATCNKLIHLNNLTADEQEKKENRTDARTRLLIHLMGCNQSISINSSLMNSNIDKHFQAIQDEKNRALLREQEAREKEIQLMRLKEEAERQRVILEQQRIQQEAQILAEKKKFGYDVWNRKVLLKNWRNHYVFYNCGSTPTVHPQSYFYIQELDGYKVAIRNCYGDYLCSRPGGQGTRVTTSVSLDHGCKFTILPTEYGRYAVLTPYGTYFRFNHNLDIQTYIDENERCLIEIQGSTPDFIPKSGEIPFSSPCKQQ
ncbi:hypothetical protein CYY_009298 [Polysphondylium violaceum]|uniref:AIG1-type G domain-containing protein n=1 Tax=Polysphondylium violaceum TaxID=133409 RepID=A0A8J4PLQ1_9MYCE|nr:hypothetical protein CYY_009298 [Polysphondylium violaceum]